MDLISEIYERIGNRRIGEYKEHIKEAAFIPKVQAALSDYGDRAKSWLMGGNRVERAANTMSDVATLGTAQMPSGFTNKVKTVLRAPVRAYQAGKAVFGKGTPAKPGSLKEKYQKYVSPHLRQGLKWVGKKAIRQAGRVAVSDVGTGLRDVQREALTNPGKYSFEEPE